jgi:hypothetical protein
MRSLLIASLAGLLSSVVIACGSADGPPLGGPYGGVAPAPVAPTAGSAESSSNSGGGTGSGAGETPTQTGGTGTGTSSGNGGNGGTGSGSGESAVDAGSNPPVVEDAGTGTSAAPTWSSIYKAYMAAGTEGNCGGCHGEMSTASGSYSYLTNKRQLGGASPEIVSPSASCLSWIGGNMPPLGPSSDATATAELQAWVAAGAQNN